MFEPCPGRFFLPKQWERIVHALYHACKGRPGTGTLTAILQGLPYTGLCARCLACCCLCLCQACREAALVCIERRDMKRCSSSGARSVIQGLHLLSADARLRSKPHQPRHASMLPLRTHTRPRLRRHLRSCCLCRPCSCGRLAGSSCARLQLPPLGLPCGLHGRQKHHTCKAFAQYHKQPTAPLTVQGLQNAEECSAPITDLCGLV